VRKVRVRDVRGGFPAAIFDVVLLAGESISWK
jgi:hypothetical protein